MNPVDRPNSGELESRHLLTLKHIRQFSVNHLVASLQQNNNLRSPHVAEDMTDPIFVQRDIDSVDQHSLFVQKGNVIFIPSEEQEWIQDRAGYLSEVRSSCTDVEH